MGADERFEERRDWIKRDIEGEMRRVREEHERKDVLKVEEDRSEGETKQGHLQDISGQEEDISRKSVV